MVARIPFAVEGWLRHFDNSLVPFMERSLWEWLLDFQNYATMWTSFLDDHFDLEAPQETNQNRVAQPMLYIRHASDQIKRYCTNEEK